MIFGEDVNFIGYPNRDKQGNYIDFNSQIGICSKSENKEEAWEFLRTLLSREYQGAEMNFQYIPTRQDCFDLKMEAEMAEEDYANELGREIRVAKGETDVDGVAYEVAPFTKEQAQQYKDMVNRAVKVYQSDKKIMNIVQEEAGSYFAGNRKLEDTVRVIQSRVTTYINESR